MYICVCHGVTSSQIDQAVRAGARQLGDLRNVLRVSAKCGRCESCALECLHSLLQAQSHQHDQSGFVLAQQAM